MLGNERKIEFKIGNTTHYADGGYEFSQKGCPVSGGSRYEYEDLISVHFNRIKAKFYNTIEASITNERQLEAIKGLVKSFCNDEYRETIKEIEYWMWGMGLLSFKPDEMLSRASVAEPLESSPAIR